MLLLPGWAMTSDLWATVMLRLNEAGLRAISCDRRGQGRSSDPGPPCPPFAASASSR